MGSLKTCHNERAGWFASLSHQNERHLLSFSVFKAHEKTPQRNIRINRTATAGCPCVSNNLHDRSGRYSYKDEFSAEVFFDCTVNVGLQTPVQLGLMFARQCAALVALIGLGMTKGKP